MSLRWRESVVKYGCKAKAFDQKLKLPGQLFETRREPWDIVPGLF